MHAHHHDEKDGGVHVGVAQVEDEFTHGVTKYPLLHGQVDDEEDGEGHDEAVRTCQVEDEDGGDGESLGSCQDAPYDEQVAGDAQEENQAEDECAYGRGEVVADHTLIRDARRCGIYQRR